MNVVKERFQALSDREQKLVLACALFLIIALFYWGVWQPLNNSIAQERNRMSSQQTLLTWVKEQAVRAQQLRRTGHQTQFSGSLPQAVNNTSAQYNIAISRMQPQGEELQVTVDEVAFNDVLAWLQGLEEMGIHILQADFAEADAPGMVRIRRLQLGKS